MHFAYRKSPSGSWVGVTALLPADMSYFDKTLFKCVNGDDGGTWAPSAPLILGGSGLDLEGPNHIVGADGVLFFDAGSKLWLSQGDDHVIDDAYVRYSVGHRSRNHVEIWNAGDIARFSPADTTAYWSTDYNTLRVTSIVAPNPTPRGSVIMTLPSRAGATLKFVELIATPAPGHSTLPTFPVEFDVRRIASTTSFFQSLLSGGAVKFTAGSVGAYQAIVSKTATCDQNNVIDRTLYSYAVVVTDEYDGVPGVPKAGLTLSGIRLTWDIPDIRPY